MRNNAKVWCCVENAPTVCLLRVVAVERVAARGRTHLGGTRVFFVLLQFVCPELLKCFSVRGWFKLQANNLVVLVRHAGTSVAGYLFINLPSLL